MNEFEERVAINDVLARYTDAVNRRDPELWGACWSDDGSWHLSADAVVGKRAIVAKWLEAMESLPYVTMFSMQGHVRIAGDTAQGISYSDEIVRTRSGKEFQITGQYEDLYLKIDDKWLFHSRRFHQRRKFQI